MPRALPFCSLAFATLLLAHCSAPIAAHTLSTQSPPGVLPADLRCTGTVDHPECQRHTARSLAASDFVLSCPAGSVIAPSIFLPDRAGFMLSSLCCQQNAMSINKLIGIAPLDAPASIECAYGENDRLEFSTPNRKPYTLPQSCSLASADTCHGGSCLLLAVSVHGDATVECACPVGQSGKYCQCAAGWSGVACSQVECAAGVDCSDAAAAGANSTFTPRVCPRGSYCPGGLLFPVACAPGQQCRNESLAAPGACPSGHFCADASEKPQPCAVPERCAEGQHADVSIIGVIASGGSSSSEASSPSHQSSADSMSSVGSTGSPCCTAPHTPAPSPASPPAASATSAVGDTVEDLDAAAGPSASASTEGVEPRGNAVTDKKAAAAAAATADSTVALWAAAAALAVMRAR